MSRLIIKNLPHGIKEDRLRNIFGTSGKITDCTLKYTTDGKFRKFAFIGYKTPAEAEQALGKLNKTFIDTSRIQVEVARDFGDQNKPRAWSKHSKESSAYQNSHKTEENPDKEKKGKKKAERVNPVVDNLLGELKENEEFQEFLDAHQNIGTKPVWTNDSGGMANKDGEMGTDEGQEVKRVKVKVTAKSRDDSGVEDSDSVEDAQETVEEKDKVAKKKGVSDLEYLKTKMADKKELFDDSDSNSSEAEMEVDEEEGKKSKKKKKKKKKKKEKKEKSPSTTSQDQESDSLFMLKMRGLPSTATEASVKEFFRPLEIIRIRIPRNTRKMPIGIAYVGFKDEMALEQAMGRNKNFLGGKRIFLKLLQEDEVEEQVEVQKPRPWESKQHQPGPDDEGIAESGRLFIRNLSYSVTEEELEELFGNFGPLTEVNVPTDSYTKKPKGFAFITYMMPEHAVKAFTSLDGNVFQGRMLHILPSKPKPEEAETTAAGGSSYKKQQDAKKKASASNSHNWNSLFLGTNAVVDVMADKYGTSKERILDDNSKGSLSVRLALGETQLVSETRDFLMENGVSLDSFSQANAPRSKTVILVKNLPSGTTAVELVEIFGKFGTLGRVVIPPSGISAIIEYMTQSEAKAGFTRLAYSKFQHVPLYLEWAPMEVFKSRAQAAADYNKDTEMDQEPRTSDKQTKDSRKSNMADSSDESEEEEVGSTLFVKNIKLDVTDAEFKEYFNNCSKVKSATVTKKKDLKNPGQVLSMGYGFVEFISPNGAMKAIKELQHRDLNGQELELKISNRETAQQVVTKEKKNKQKSTKQKTTKILVRNIPFEAKKSEIEELFKVFGELKFVRLPKKLSGTGTHRGFGFVDFLTKQDAKRAFKALCHSTHLYGRRLVLEWADTAAEDIDELRKRTAEHFHDGGDNKRLTKSNLMDKLQSPEDD